MKPRQTMSVKAELLCLEYWSPHLFSLCGVCWAVSGTLWNPRGHTLKCSPPLCLVAQSYLTFATPWTIGHQAPLCTGFSRQVYWSGLSLPPRGDRPNPGMETVSLMPPSLAGGFFTTSATWKATLFNNNLSILIH